MDRPHERRGRGKMLQLGRQRGQILRAQGARVGVGDARGQVVRLVDHQQRVLGGKAGLVVKDAPVVGREDVVVVADPHVVEHKRGQGNLIGAEPRRAPGLAEGAEVARLVFEQIKPRQPAARPARLKLVEVAAGLARALINRVHAMLAFRPHRPRLHPTRFVTYYVTNRIGSLRGGGGGRGHRLPASA